jgi:mycothiol synthase
MAAYASRAYTRAQDLEQLIKFAELASAVRMPRSTYLKPGDVVWAMYNVDRSDDIRLWFDDDGLAAYAIFEAPLHVDFDLRPDRPIDEALLDAILAWAGERRRTVGRGANIPKAYAMLGNDVLSSRALQSDVERIAMLKRRGHARVDRFSILYEQSLAEAVIEPAQLQLGLKLRHVTDSDSEERVDLHREAWSVWGPSKATVENYRRLRAAPLYNPELDVVLEDPRGRFLAYCVGWLDHANAVGHFEPVGCRPDSTGRGYTRAVIVEGLRRMQARGMHTAMVATESVNPPAMRLYLSCGFVEVDRAYHYTKRVVGWEIRLNRFPATVIDS